MASSPVGYRGMTDSNDIDGKVGGRLCGCMVWGNRMDGGEEYRWEGREEGRGGWEG